MGTWVQPAVNRDNYVDAEGSWKLGYIFQSDLGI
jgi:hypothetical protein